jgi:hypothetical protein
MMRRSGTIGIEEQAKAAVAGARAFLVVREGTASRPGQGLLSAVRVGGQGEQVWGRP